MHQLFLKKNRETVGEIKGLGFQVKRRNDATNFIFSQLQKRVAKQEGIFPGFTAHKWRQISQIYHMGFLQNGPI